jgi:hypothetical protein
MDWAGVGGRMVIGFERGRWRRFGRCPFRVGSEKRAAAFDRSLAPAVGEEAVGADADEVDGEDVEEEAACELAGFKGHGPLLVGMGVVLPGEGHGVRIDGEEAMVGDGDAVGVSGQVLERLLGSAEGRFRVDAPVAALRLGEQTAECGSIIVEVREGAMKAKPACIMSGANQGEPLTAKDATEHAHG